MNYSNIYDVVIPEGSIIIGNEYDNDNDNEYNNDNDNDNK